MGPLLQFKVLGFLLVLLCAARVPVAVAFDLEDYATTYRATRDAWLQASNEYELAIQGYLRYRNYAQDAGINPNDALLLQSLLSDSLRGGCNGEQFAAASSALALLVRHVLPYVTPTDRGNFLRGDGIAGGLLQAITSYRAGRDSALQDYEALIAGNAPSVTGPPLVDLGAADRDTILAGLIARRDAALTAQLELSFATPPFKAAYAAYLGASQRYQAGIRKANEYLWARQAVVNGQGVAASRLMSLIQPLPRELRRSGVP